MFTTTAHPRLFWLAPRRFIKVPAGFTAPVVHPRWVPFKHRATVVTACIIDRWLRHRPTGATTEPAPGIYDGHPQAMRSARRLGPGDPALVVRQILRPCPVWVRVMTRLYLWGIR